MKEIGFAILISVLTLVSCKKAPEPAASPAGSDDQKSAKVATPAASKPAAAASQSSGEKISFSSQVRPILSNSCFACHGPDAQNQSSPFRLDTEEHARANLAKAGDPPRFGIVPGKPEQSLLLQRITTHDPNALMPPPTAKKPPVNEEQIAVITEWIRQGAKYEPHWAFIAPVKPTVPEVKDKAWPRTPIDNFILALNSTEVTDRSVDFFSKFPNLTQLAAWDTTVSPDAAKTFVKTRFPENKKRHIEEEIKALNSRLIAMKVEVLGIDVPDRAPPPTPAPSPSPDPKSNQSPEKP